MKKQRGFTLVELLAVIVILGIILSISTVAIVGIKEKQDKKNKKNVISSILTGAKAYNAEEKFDESISVSDLIDSGYVDFDQNKYSDLLEMYVEKINCDDELKLKVMYTLGKYNDCGCEAQVAGFSTELCE